MIFTPGQLTERSEFYYQLCQLTAAGISLNSALTQLERSPPARSYREPIARVLKQLAAGNSLSEALHRVDHWLPAFDLTMIEAGEKSGRLDQSFRLLADHYGDRARMTRQMIADLAYPIFLFHFAILIFAFVRFMAGSSSLFIVIGGLLPLYALAAALVYVMQSQHGEKWRATIEALLHPLPVLGAGRRYVALARLAAALEALLSAGISIVQAWELAATASGSPALRQTVLAWKPLLDAGHTPAEVIRQSGQFPELFTNQYASAEISGQLDESLRRLHHYYREEGSRKLHAVAKWVPMAIYITVMLIVAYFIIQFWMGHFRDIGNAGGF